MQIPNRIEWNENVEKFPTVKRNVEGFFLQTPLAYIFEDSFLAAYKDKGPNCYQTLDFRGDQ